MTVGVFGLYYESVKGRKQKFIAWDVREARGGHMWQNRMEVSLNLLRSSSKWENVQSSLHFCRKGGSEMRRRKSGTERIMNESNVKQVTWPPFIDYTADTSS